MTKKRQQAQRKNGEVKKAKEAKEQVNDVINNIISDQEKHKLATKWSYAIAESLYLDTSSREYIQKWFYAALRGLTPEESKAEARF